MTDKNAVHKIVHNSCKLVQQFIHIYQDDRLNAYIIQNNHLLCYTYARSSVLEKMPWPFAVYHNYEL